MKSVLVLLFSIIITASFAQTKVIAFKSHSGNMKNFGVAMENELFVDASNFGIPSSKSSYQLTCVLYLSKSKVLVTKKVFMRGWSEPKDSARFVGIETDTLYNHPLFSKKHSLDSIRQVLKNSKEYDGNSDEIIFMGYDNGKKNKENKINLLKTNEKLKENNITPIVPFNSDDNNHNLFDTKMIQALAMIFLLALLGGWLSWKIANYNSKKDKIALDKLSVT